MDVIAKVLFGVVGAVVVIGAFFYQDYQERQQQEARYRQQFSRGSQSPRPKKRPPDPTTRKSDRPGSSNGDGRAYYNDECPICTENIMEKNSYMLLECGHRMHYKCTIRLAQTGPNLKCPICRKPICLDDD